VYKVRPGKAIIVARINPDGTFLDAVPANDAWKRPAAAATP
jgi:hypothetical protein